jgi:hypothetical protein
VPRFALDHNFPVQIISDVWPPSIELVRLGDIDSRMTEWDDWQIILELDRRGGYDGLITDDGDMLALPNAMVALARTSLSLVVADAAGHQPIKAAGLLMIYLPAIINSRPRGPSIFVLSVDEVGRKKRDVYECIRRIARQENVADQDLRRAVNRDLDAWLEQEQ